MSPEDLELVRRSWGELAPERALLAERLADALAGVVHDDDADGRATCLVECVAELIDLLSAPSRLDERARLLGAGWARRPPTAAVDGCAWVAAAGAIDPTWNLSTAAAWHHAWLVLADVLADGAVSPFAGTT